MWGEDYGRRRVIAAERVRCVWGKRGVRDTKFSSRKERRGGRIRYVPAAPPVPLAGQHPAGEKGRQHIIIYIYIDASGVPTAPLSTHTCSTTYPWLRTPAYRLIAQAIHTAL